MHNYFSIITPVFNGQFTIGRTIRSVLNQTYSGWEMIIVDDGSQDGTRDIVKSYMAKRQRKDIRMFCLPENCGRLTARNLGMRMARNQWIIWLDADDEIMSNYLEVLNDEISRNLDYGIFNFGMLVKDREMIEEKRYEKGYRIIEPLKLKELDTGMESFDKGKIGTGSFVFKKELLKEIGYFPETKVPYGGEDSFPALLVQKDKIFEQICKKNNEGQWLPLGNPWGDDRAFYWRLTRNNKSKCLDVILYIQHIRI